MKVTGSKETLRFDPITGISTPIIDPVYGQESTRVEESTRYIITEEKVISWKVEQELDRD